MSPGVLMAVMAFFVVYFVKVVALVFKQDRLVRFCELWLAGVCLLILFRFLRVFAVLG